MARHVGKRGVATLVVVAALFGCKRGGSEVRMDHLTSRRHAMVEHQIAARGVRDARVLEAMRRVLRHRFVPASFQEEAYADTPLPIGQGQTISQPYIVAYMTEALRLKPKDRVLEVGTGSGYQAAVLAELVAQVDTIEIVAPLAKQARKTLDELGYRNIHFKIGDGYAGWPERAPYDAIIVTAAPGRIPPPLLEQLADGGCLVIPVGTVQQALERICRKGKELVREELLPVRFVPMTGRAQEAP